MDDSISRQAAIDYLLDKGMITSAIYIEQMPSTLRHTDLSTYSDKLWKTAYERGKAEAQAEIVRCKECKNKAKCYRDVVMQSKDGGYIYSPLTYCSQAERRTDE